MSVHAYSRSARPRWHAARIAAMCSRRVRTVTAFPADSSVSPSALSSTLRQEYRRANIAEVTAFIVVITNADKIAASAYAGSDTAKDQLTERGATVPSTFRWSFAP